MSGETLRIRRQVTQGNLLFGEYTLMRVLAQGPIGLVCEAEHNSLKRRCALKMVHPTYAEKQGFSLSLIDAFLREARIMAAVDHPHVVPVYHAGTVGQCPFIAMRLIKGGTLQARIDKSGAVTPDWALRLLLGCADGLRAIHGAGFRHGSMLPEHLLLEEDGAPRLAGFDLAMPLEAARPVVSGSAPAHPLAAPEVASGGALGVRSDLWSLAASISVALGQPPEAVRAGLTNEQLTSAVMSANPAAGRSALLTGLTAVLAHALVEDPQARYASAEELVEDCKLMAAGGAPLRALGRTRSHKDQFTGWHSEPANDDPFPP